jgi:hypothetical protein
MTELTFRLRPLVEDDLAMFRRFALEPGLIGLDWAGYRDPEVAARRSPKIATSILKTGD